MAALTLTLALAPTAWLTSLTSHTARGDEPTSTPDAPTPHTVKLELRIAGLTSQGCEVDIKPAHPGCKFRPVKQTIDRRGYATIVMKDVVTRSADRDCTFAITIREAGQSERTFHRGLRLQSRDTAAGQLMTCYLSSPSEIARNGGDRGTTKR
jgi:hypothetical protein